ncbi:MAG: hypothetical protein WAO20_07280 [Acidobacteriota bacterium]
MKARKLSLSSLISLAILALVLIASPLSGQGNGGGSGGQDSGGQNPDGQQPGGNQNGDQSGGQSGGDQAAQFSGWQGLEVERNLILPQVAVGGDITTTLVLGNLGSRLRQGWLSSDQLITTGSLHFFSSAGADLSVTIGGVTAPEHTFSLGPSGVQFYEVTASGDVQTGWLLISVDDPTGANSDSAATDDWGYMDDQHVDRGKRLLATAYYTITDSTGAVESQVAVLPAVLERARFFNSFLPVQYGNGIDTGVAIVNTGSEEAEIRLVLRNSAGETVAEEVLPISAGSQIARYVDQVFGSSTLPQEFKGILEVTTDSDGIVTLGLLQTGRVLTSLPLYHFGRWHKD